MKKSVLKVAILAMTGLVFTSCAISKQSSNKNVDVIFTPVISQPKVLEYDVKFGAKAVATIDKKMKRGETSAMYIDLALAEAISKSSSDFLFEPSIKVQRKGRKKVMVEVSGYPAVYTGAKNVDYSDSTEVANYIVLSKMNAMKRSMGLKSGEGQKRQGLFKRMRMAKQEIK